MSRKIAKTISATILGQMNDNFQVNRQHSTGRINFVEFAL